MATSSLIVYQPLDTFREKREYWNNYVIFYENYWGGPTSPYGVWFGKEYENFRDALSKHLEIDEEDIEDCFFMKDKEGRYYISPFSSETDSYILYSENYIPLYWFILFEDKERESFYTTWGFAGINYDTRIALGLKRLKEADEILNNLFQKYKGSDLKSPHILDLSEVQTGIANLRAWLIGFDPSAYVVLNYGELCSFIHPYTMKNERSVKEIWDILSLIREGQIEEAQSMLSILVNKWEEIKRKASGDIDRFTVQ
jgi:hypothetical protein